MASWDNLSADELRGTEMTQEEFEQQKTDFKKRKELTYRNFDASAVTLEARDEKGKVVGSGMFNKGSDEYNIFVNNLKTGSNDTLYSHSDGTISAKPEASIKMDSETGKVSIMAPKEALKNEKFKDYIDSVANVVSVNQKLNKNYKYALLTDGGEKTSADWINDVNKDIQKMSDEAVYLESTKSELKNETGKDFTDEQARKRGTIALAYDEKTGKVSTASEDSMQALPTRIKNLNVFKNLEGWDEKNHVVSLGNLKEKWSRVGIGGDGSDENILDVYRTVEDYFEEGDFSDQDEYVEMLAFRDFIKNQKAETGVIQGIIDVATAGAEALFTGSMEFWEDAFTSAEGLFNFAGRAGAKLAGGESQYKDLDFFSKEVRYNLDSMKKDITERNMLLNPSGAVVYTVGDAIVPVAMQIVVGNALSEAAAAGAVSALGKLAEAGKKSKEIGVGMATIFSKRAIAAGDFIDAAGDGIKALDASIDITKAVYSGTSLILKAAPAKAATESILRAVKLIDSVGKIAQSAKVVSVTKSIAGFAAEVAVDIALTDPRLFSNFMKSKDVDSESKAYMLDQLSQNAIGNALGFAGVKAASKAIKGFQNTNVGAITSAFGTRLTKGVTSRIAQKADDFATILHGGNADWLNAKYKKALKTSKEATEKTSGFLSQRILNNRAHKLGKKVQAQGTNRILREAAINATSSKAYAGVANSETFLEKAASARKYTNDVREAISKANNFANKIYRQNVSGKTAELIERYDSLKSARETYSEALGRVIKNGESKAGKTFLKDIEDGIAKLPADQNEFVNAIHRVKVAEDYIKNADKVVDGDTISLAKKELDHWRTVAANFRDDNSLELVEALEDLEIAGSKLSQANTAVRKSEGVLAEEIVEGWSESGYFEQGYMRQQRAKSWEQDKRSGGKLSKAEIKKGKPRKDQHYSWGNIEDEWQDITVVLFDDINETSRMIIRKEMTDSLKDIGEKVEVIISGDDVILASKVSAERAGAMKSLQDSIKKSVGEMNEDIFKDVVYKQKVGEYIVAKSEKDTLESGRRIAEASASQPKVYPREKVAFINNMDGEQLDELISTYGKENPFSMTVENDDDFKMFLDKLDPKTRKIVTSRMDGQVGYLFDAPMGDYDRRLAEISKMPKYNRSAWEKATGKKVPAWASQFVINKGGKELEDLTVVNELKKLVNDTKTLKKTGKEAGDIYTLDNFYATLDNDEDLALELKRSYSANNKDIRDNKAIEDIISDQKREQTVFDRQTIYADNVERMNELKKTYDLEDIREDIDKQLDDAIDTIVENNINNKSISEPVGMLDDSEKAIEYMTLKEMSSKENKATLRKKVEAKARDNYNQILTSRNQAKIAQLEEAKKAGSISQAEYKNRLGELKKEGSLISKRSEEWGKEAGQWFDDKLEIKFGRVQAELAEKGSDILDYGDYFGKIDAINKEIAGAEKADDIIKTYDAAGRAEYIRVSPTVASMMTTMPPELQRSVFGKIQQAFCKAFRRGTTGGLVPGSLVRQGFRDVGSTLGLGDAWKDSKYVRRQLIETFGDTIAEDFQKNMPDVWSALIEKSGGDVAKATEAAVDMEMRTGKAIATKVEKESELYNFVQKNKFARDGSGKYDESTFTKIRDGLNEFSQKFEKLNDIRENALRTKVYHNNFLKGIKDGMSVEESRRFAKFMSEEATTNFSRGTYHFANLAESVPYLGAAINSSKSFWRLYTLDPVGVTTRIFGGFVVPTMALTTLSLSNEEDKRIYKQIPEWQKDDNFVLVMNGQIMSIPIPQEISAVVRPIQTMIERIQGVNDKSFGELMLNDLIGFVPTDLSGFLNVDRDRILDENLVDDHLIPGVMKLLSSTMGPLEKSAFMLATNIDPYTGKYIDTNRVYYDEETGESITMDTSTSESANLLSKFFGGNISPKMAQKLIKNLFGEGGQMLGDGFVGLGQAVVDGPGGESTIWGELQEMGVDAVSDAVDSMSIERYDEEANLAWNRAVSKLYREKESITGDPQFQADLNALKGGKLSESAEKEVRSRVNSRIEEYQQKVLTASQNLVTEYNGSFDRFKFGSVVSLLNMYDKTSTTGANLNNASSSSLDKEQSSMNYAAALETMQNLGFTSPDDGSIFGYYDNNKQDFVYKDPLSILNFKQNSYQQAKLHGDSIDILLKEKDDDGKTMYQKHKDFTDSLKPLYESKDYDEIDKRILEWDKEVMKKIAPYVSRMTPEAAINNYEVMNILRSVIEVPSSFEKTKYGKFFSLDSKYGSKPDAFVEGWIKSMYGINDKYKGQYEKEKL